MVPNETKDSRSAAGRDEWPTLAANSPHETTQAKAQRETNGTPYAVVVIPPADYGLCF